MQKLLHKLQLLLSLWSVRLLMIYLVLFTIINVTDRSAIGQEDIGNLMMLLGPVCGFGLGMDTSRMNWSRASGLLAGFAIVASALLSFFDYVAAYIQTHAIAEFKAIYLLSYLLIACFIFGLSAAGRYAGHWMNRHVSN